VILIPTATAVWSPGRASIPGLTAYEAVALW
jgi:hypothetical protein